MVRKHKKSLVWSVLQKMFHFITATKQEQLPGRFSAVAQIYQSQLGKSSLPKGNQPHYHICMSLQLDWALRANSQPSFLTKLPFM